MKATTPFLLAFAMMLALAAGCTDNDAGTASPTPAGLDHVSIGGELGLRIQQNFLRLQADKYQPENVFLTEEQSGGWPGDTEGRTILGLVCDSRALSQGSAQLEQIISLIPEHLNSLGYMGPEYGDILNEQQLSGNGWMLRGLCAYYDMTSDERALGWIRSISENLFIKGKGKYSSYPIDPSLRVTGEGRESGNISDVSGEWMLSTDTGCVFIGMEGLIDAYRLVGTPEMKEVIEELLNRFLEVDLVGIQAQTHASLTACRGLVRYAEITGESKWIDEAKARWEIYKEYGMTENYENYNWFGRFDTWTEPCAIVDSYLLALKLWQHTMDNTYLRDAQLIYYNAICHTQRSNGGFGCDSCPGEASGPELFVKTDEAHWCCTMRGAEGLSTAAASLWMRDGNTFYLTDFRTAMLSEDGVVVESVTDCPREGSIRLTVHENALGSKLKIKMFVPDWIIPDMLEVGGKEIPAKVGEDGFITFSNVKAGESIILEYSFAIRREKTMNAVNTRPDQERYFYGPLILDEGGKPIYHLMDPKVSIASGYRHKIIFVNGK